MYFKFKEVPTKTNLHVEVYDSRTHKLISPSLKGRFNKKFNCCEFYVEKFVPPQSQKWTTFKLEKCENNINYKHEFDEFKERQIKNKDRSEYKVKSELIGEVKLILSNLNEEETLDYENLKLQVNELNKQINNYIEINKERQQVKNKENDINNIIDKYSKEEILKMLELKK